MLGDQNALTTVHLDPTEKHGGQAALRVDDSFAGNRDLEYVQVARPLDIPEPGLGIGFWLKTDGTPFPVRLRVTDTSREFAGKGSLWIDGVALVKTRPQPDTLRLETSAWRFGNVYEPGDAISLRLTGAADRLPFPYAGVNPQPDQTQFPYPFALPSHRD